MKFSYILKGLFDTFKNILPITLLLIFIQKLLFKKPIKNVKSLTFGMILTTLGLFLFLEGTSLFLLPLGESVGENLISLDNKWLILLLVFIIGFSTTLIEPALSTLAAEVEEISIGSISRKVLIYTVAVGFGLGLSTGVYKILYSIQTSKIVIPLLALSIILCIFAPDKMVGIAFDCASSTTGPVNIPLNLTIALGLSRTLENSDPLLNAFGIIGLTSIGPILSVLMLGILSK